jgi:hypothetical protein
MASLQKAAETYKKLGIIQRDIKVSEVFQSDLIPPK